MTLFCSSEPIIMINLAQVILFYIFAPIISYQTMEELFIGREKEQNEIAEYLDSNRSEFIAIYGRRRVGKTYFIRKTTAKNACFSMTGMDNVTMNEQLMNFDLALRKKMSWDTSRSKNWLEAFYRLANYLESLPEGKKIIVIDELPWMDTPKSMFISALGHFWNDWASARNDIKLIVCGSATSWMINKLINNRGGLHNRVTHQIQLLPFTLKECQAYFEAYGFGYEKLEIAECYMVMGGIPFYFSFMKPELSVAQNINKLFFSEGAELKNEFSNLYKSLFKQSDDHIKIVEALASKTKGLTRQELLKSAKVTNNGNTTTILQELESCGFIRHYEPFTTKRKQSNVRNNRVSTNTLYQLIDFYTSFYFNIIQKNIYKDNQFWISCQNSPLHNAWSGYAFEMLCLTHSQQIKKALEIGGIQSMVCSWIGSTEEGNAQIDLLIDRADKTINLCEIKYSEDEYVITKDNEKEWIRKTRIFREATKTKKSIMFTLLTSCGIKANQYSGRIQKQVTVDELFQ